ncbi:MAG TPA: methylenetetrahydrofolate reductase, partial [Nocardioides sp.]|nr:methylenetetrahydrofolate reductase [Nocardioides sp.]
MRNKDREAIRRLLRHARYEVLPTATVEAKVLGSVPTDIPITITASPSMGLERTVELAESLTARGYDVVPHLAARMVSGRPELTELVERLTATGVTNVFVPGGDAQAVGDYPDALSMLEDLTAMGSPFKDVGVAGYPESHPTINDDLTIQSMWDKRKHATYVVSNLTFDPGVVKDWVHRMRLRGINLP